MSRSALRTLILLPLVAACAGDPAGGVLLNVVEGANVSRPAELRLSWLQGE